MNIILYEYTITTNPNMPPNCPNNGTITITHTSNSLRLPCDFFKKSHSTTLKDARGSKGNKTGPNLYMG